MALHVVKSFKYLGFITYAQNVKILSFQQGYLNAGTTAKKRYTRLLHKPYIYEVILTEHILY